MFSAGTVSTLPNGDLLLQSAPERFVAWVVVFLLGAPVSLWLWRRGVAARYSAGAFIVSWIIPLVIVPGIAMESVRLTSDALLIETGYWFAPNRMRYALAGVSRIEEGRNRRGDLTWTFGTRSLNLPDLLEANRQPVTAALGSRGVQVIPNSNKQE